MAVTITQSPQAYTPSDNPVTWVFTSNQTGQANFYFGVTVYVNAQVHSFHEVVPESGAYAKFDASDIVRDRCTAPTIFPDIAVVDAGNNCTVYIIVQEYFGTPPSVQAGATSATVTCWKARLDNRTWNAYQLNNYLPSQSRSRWLTQCPEHLVGQGDLMWLCVITQRATDYRLRATLYDVNGSQIATNTTSAVNYAAIPIAQFRVDPNALMVRHGFSLADIEDTHYYTVEFGKNSAWAQETIYIDRTCLNVPAQEVHFLTRIGSIEQFRFTKLRTDNMTVSRVSYEKAFGSWAGTSFVYNNSSGQQLAYISAYDTTIRVTSDWISEALQKWLVYNLLTSPLTLLYEDTQRVTVEDQGAEIHNEAKNDPLFQQFVQLKLSAKNYSPLL
jgi:hypothetical protein